MRHGPYHRRGGGEATQPLGSAFKPAHSAHAAATQPTRKPGVKVLEKVPA